MERCYPLTVSASSLMVGLVSSPYIDKGVQAAIGASGWSPGGGVYYLLWVGVYISLCLGVFLVVLPLVAFVVWVTVGRREQVRRQRQMVNILDTADAVLSQLRVLTDEFRRETVYDRRAEEKLSETAAKVDMVIRRAASTVSLAGTHAFAPALDELMRAVTRHASAEIVGAFTPTGSTAQGQTKKMVSRSAWGAQCVRMLVGQLHEHTRTHALFPGRGEAKAAGVP